jgi:hypothetical protein
MDTRRRDELVSELLSRLIITAAVEDPAMSSDEFLDRRADLFTILQIALARAIAVYSFSGEEADQIATHLGDTLITYVRGHRVGDEKGH